MDNVEMFNYNARYKETCFFYRNLGNWKFADFTGQLGSDFKVIGGNRGVVVADFDNDGNLEVVVSRLNDAPLFFKKKGGPANNWILMQLVGKRCNSDAIGSKIKITLPSGSKQFNHVSTANGIYSASDKRVHFGLRTESSIKELEIQWLGGSTQKLQDVKANQVLKIVESQN